MSIIFVISITVMVRGHDERYSLIYYLSLVIGPDCDIYQSQPIIYAD